MGKTIISWSPVIGQGASTSNMAALVSVLSLSYDYENIAMHTKPSRSNLEAIFGKKVDNSSFMSGTSALMRLSKSGKINLNNMKDYAEIVYKDKLDLLCNIEGLSNSKDFVKSLIPFANKIYDLVWVDLCSGEMSEKDKDMISSSDLLVISLSQNKFLLDSFFKDFHNSFFKNKNIVFVMGMYDESLSLNISKIRREYKIKNEIIPIPYSSGYKNSINKLAISKFFYQNILADKNNPNMEFIEALSKANEKILESLNMNSKREV